MKKTDTGGESRTLSAGGIEFATSIKTEGETRTVPDQEGLTS
jgi:hypothetical protein